jgi:hypothetical protein
VNPDKDVTHALQGIAKTAGIDHPLIKGPINHRDDHPGGFNFPDEFNAPGTLIAARESASFFPVPQSPVLPRLTPGGIAKPWK